MLRNFIFNGLGVTDIKKKLSKISILDKEKSLRKNTRDVSCVLQASKNNLSKGLILIGRDWSSNAMSPRNSFGCVRYRSPTAYTAVCVFNALLSFFYNNTTSNIILYVSALQPHWERAQSCENISASVRWKRQGYVTSDVSHNERDCLHVR